MIALTLFWIIAFRSFFLNPWSFATSETISRDFPLWRHIGEQLRKGQLPHDPYYNPTLWGIPFCNMWYPTHLITSWVGSHLPLDISFLLFMGHALIHYLFASVCAYLLFLPYGILPALFGAITLVYAQPYIRTCCFQMYSICWIPFILLTLTTGHPILAGVGCYMLMAGGYPGIMMYTLPIFLFIGWEHIGGFLLSLTLCIPQTIVTSRYLKTSVRTLQKYKDRAIGSLPLWHIVTQPLLLTRKNLNGVLYPETSLSIGRIALVIGCISIGMNFPTLILCLSIYLMMGRYSRSPIPMRVAARGYYLWPIAWAYLVMLTLSTLQVGTEILAILLLLHSWDIIANNIPNMLFFPFMEEAGKPSEQFDTPLTRYLTSHMSMDDRVSGLPHPLFTGYIGKYRTLGYVGGCEELEHWRWIGSGNPQGSSSHDWFDFHPYDNPGDVRDIKYAYTHECPRGWGDTPVKNLYVKGSNA